ncbi:phage tail tape measure protein, partial [Pseudomonas aeruginosa]
AGVGREYGQSLETVTTATALLGNAGVQGSMAGTSMRSVLTRLGTSKAVAKLGVQTKDANGNMRDMLDILKDINKKTAGMGNVQRGAIFKDIAGQYAVTSFGTLMRAV